MASSTPRGATLEPTRAVSISIAGHLTVEALERSFAGVAEELASSAAGELFDLVVDAELMTGYDADARARFVEWNAANKRRIRRVAILTDKVLWHMVVAAMSVASGQKMRAFGTRAQADAWLSEATPAR